MNVDNFGIALTRGISYDEVRLWSNPLTWGNDDLPAEGESVSIPVGTSILFDVDSTPVLDTVIVEGSLFFISDADSEHVRTFDAHNIIIQGGYMEVGTEEQPYTSKLIFTMHGTPDSAKLPIFGSKTLAVSYGQLEMHGAPREVTWTQLESTVSGGSQTLTFVGSVDFKEEDEIVIAGTGNTNDEHEVSVISSMVDDVTAEIADALSFDHKGELNIYEDIEVPMRAEVGLLSRNIVFQGDASSFENNFGATLMVMSTGDESSVSRIEYVEFRNVGQVSSRNGFPVNYMIAGSARESYIRGNSIRGSYNRAIALSSASELSVSENVVYNVKGHAYFLQNGVEVNNQFSHNLAVNVLASDLLRKTD